MPKTFPAYRSPLMQYFEYSHLPPHLQQASKRFAELAEAVDGVLSVQLELYRGRIADELCARTGEPHRPEWVQLYPDRFPDHLRAAYLQSERALEKLLEAKDCAVRAAKALGDAVKAGEVSTPKASEPAK